jgi:hypothetical protein
LTEEEVRAAREGKGTHKLTERAVRATEYAPGKPARGKKVKG